MSPATLRADVAHQTTLEIDQLAHSMVRLEVLQERAEAQHQWEQAEDLRWRRLQTQVRRSALMREVWLWRRR